MKRVLVYSNQIDGKKVPSILENGLPYSIYGATTLSQCVNLFKQARFRVFVCEIEKLEKEELDFFKKLRQVSFQGPILLLIKTEGPIQKKRFKSNQRRLNMNSLVAPYDTEAILGYVRKLASEDTLPYQEHRRYRTNEKVLIEFLEDGKQLESSMINLSRGGGHYLIPNTEEVFEGSLIKIRVNLSNVEKSHIVFGKIIWKSFGTKHSSGYRGVGVKFLRGSEIYSPGQNPQ